MISNKKSGLSYIFMTIIVLSFFSFIYLFTSTLFIEVGDKYILSTIENVSLQVVNQQGLSPTIENIVKNTRTDYITNVNSFPYDLVFLSSIIALFTSNIFFSWKTRKYGYFSFFGFLTVGMMFFMGFISIMEQVRTYLMNNYYYAIFGHPIISTPIIDFFNNNFPLIAFFWIIIMLLVNQFDKDLLNRNAGRFEE